jgi:Bacterial protein of unknown function (DUF839)
MRVRSILGCTALMLVITVWGAAPGVAKPGKDGFKTSKPPMLTPVRAGVTVTPLMTVGDRLANGFRFEAIPDGISLRRHDRNRAEVFVNHETGKVPFPFNRSNPNEANGENDFDNSQVSRLMLNRRTAGVLTGSFAITGSLGYQRFCSNYLATWREGFTREILLTNEESPDYVFRQEDSWPPPMGHPQEEEAGLAIALEPNSGKTHEIHGMGRHNHENSVPIPGYGKPVVLSGDDTFTSGPLTGVAETPNVPAQSQLYSYIADSTNDLLKDKGDLWAFRSTTPGVNSYYDVPPNSPMQIEGEFIKVPRRIATGLNPDGSERRSDDEPGYPEPPNNGTWQADLRKPSPPNPAAEGIDGPQWVLQHWSDRNRVFQFVRVEDIAYDKRPGMGNVVYIADSGRGRTVAQQAIPDTPNFRSSNGRIWKMVLDKRNPRRVTSLSVFVDGEDNPVQFPTEIHQPDNLESTPNGLLVTEDPGSSQQFPVGSTDPRATTARLWHVPIASPAAMNVVARVDQSTDNAPGDVGPTLGNQGAWESSGIVDASHAFGPDTFLVDVQAHTYWVERAPGDDNYGPWPQASPDGIPDFTYKREGGQLLLIRIPGG